MPTIQLLRNGQLTLPDRIRRALGLARGDLLNVSLVGERIVLTPVTTAAREEVKEREEAKRRLFKLIDKAREWNKDVDPKEIEAIVAEAVAAAKAEELRAL